MAVMPPNTNSARIHGTMKGFTNRLRRWPHLWHKSRLSELVAPQVLQSQVSIHSIVFKTSLPTGVGQATYQMDLAFKIKPQALSSLRNPTNHAKQTKPA